MNNTGHIPSLFGAVTVVTAGRVYVMPKHLHNTWAEAIEEGARICGSQNELARALGTSSGNLAKAKQGRRPMPFAQVERLAEIVHGQADHLHWLMHRAVTDYRHKPRV